MILERTTSALAAIETTSITTTDFAARGFHLEIQVTPENLTGVVDVLDREGFFIEAITGVDLLTFAPPPKPAPKKTAAEGEENPPAPPPPEPVAPQMEAVYDFNHFDELCRVTIRVRIPRDTPEIPTISSIFPGADWHERETHDFFGIQFIGHPYLEPLLLPEDADFHPLLKDFKA